MPSPRVDDLTQPATTSMVDVIYPLHAKALPRDHRQALARALERLLPWLADSSQACLHRINVVSGIGPVALLAQRSRLVLRVRRARLGDLSALAGARIDVAGFPLRIGAAGQVRELLAHGTLYTHLAVSGDSDELAFVVAMERELAALGAPCRCICGRRQEINLDGTPLTGFSLMLDGLSPQASLRVLDSGLGLHRSIGCGLFVPHRSAAAVAA